MRRRAVGWTLAAGLVAAACGGSTVPGAALDSITVDGIKSEVAVLASDSLGGRGPSSIGEERTLAYLQSEFSQLGLEPGNGKSWYQEVPMVRITTHPDAELTVRGGGAQARFRYADDFVANTKHLEPTVSLTNSDMVFVGYGIVAPEYDWNDYAGLDVKGKTVVILVNDPGFATGDTALFHGKTMTYYGRWTYKYEEASRQGAAAALIVHETEPAAYPWGVVRNSWSGPQFSLAAPDDNASRVPVEGWVTVESARAIMKLAGQDYDALKAKAMERGFQPVPLGVSASLTLHSDIMRSSSRNFLAQIRGTDHADEYVIYTAHWDHFGTDTTRQGDQIFNGAVDNATGVAGLIELARAYKTLSSPPSRSILFLAVTGEEQGLLGSQYYASNPVVPLQKTVADINMDAMNVNGRMKDIVVVGLGMSQLDDYVEAAAKEQGRVVRPDQEPEKGYYYRSDHFSFAKAGVPALDPGSGEDNVEHGIEWTKEREADYRVHRYHQPSDEYDPNWDLSGMVDDLRLFFTVGYRLATSRDFPNWRPGTEFKAKRDSMMMGEK
jgi:Zn-dependent M28 family amino/carboxypeptidase